MPGGSRLEKKEKKAKKVFRARKGREEKGSKERRGSKEWKKAYESGVIYSLHEAVSYAGSSYISIKTPNVGHTPGVGGSEPWWEVIAQEGAKGIEGKEGPKGTALAYAHIMSNGSVDEVNSSKAFTKEATVKEAEAGIYCITGLASFTPHNVVATIDANETNEVAIPLLSATIGQGPEAICPAGTQITVEKCEASAGKKR